MVYDERKFPIQDEDLGTELPPKKDPYKTFREGRERRIGIEGRMAESDAYRRDQIDRLQRDVGRYFDEEPEEPSVVLEGLGIEETEKSIDDEITLRWNKLSFQERDRYKNENGEFDLEKFKQKLAENKEKIIERLEQIGIILDPDIYDELIMMNYYPEEMQINIDDLADVLKRIIFYPGIGLPIGPVVGGIVEAIISGSTKIPTSSGAKLGLLGGVFVGAVAGLIHGFKNYFLGSIKMKLDDFDGRRIEKFSKKSFQELIGDIKVILKEKAEKLNQSLEK